MAYALFAQKKLMYTGLINTIQNQQTQRADEQYKIATRTLNLQNKISAIQEGETEALAKCYEALTNLSTDGTKASSAPEAMLDSITTVSGKLIPGGKNKTKSEIESVIDEIEKDFEDEIDKINTSIKYNTTKENRIEMEVKRLDTRITALKKQLEKIEEAESEGIDKATPNFKGLG